ncbi:MAG: hypothetical protein ACP5Q5_09250 [Brevinematia bacterium]
MNLIDSSCWIEYFAGTDYSFILAISRKFQAKIFTHDEQEDVIYIPKN